MELEKALERISEIHAHVARGEIFRGYRAIPIAVTSVIALAAAAVQDVAWPAGDAHAFVVYWVAAAGLSATVCAWDFWLQGRFADPVTLRRRTWPVVAQYLPAVAVGAVLAITLARSEHAELLPALWAVVHGLGVFASRPYLPRSVGWVSAWYVVAGAWLLVDVEPGAGLPGAWSVGIPFGVGQALLALVLYANVAREEVKR